MDDRAVRGMLAAVAEVPDPRREHGKLHRLSDILVIALCAVVAGCDDFCEIEAYGKVKREFLARFLALPNGIPSHDTFNRVLSLLNPRALSECVVRWLRALHDVQDLKGEVVALDGKTLRRTIARTTGKARLHLVSAWATSRGLTLAQVAVDEKSNEITALPELIRSLDLQGAVVTIDAMGCQQEIAAEIRTAKADYVLALKANQETTFAAVVDEFTAHLEADDPPPGAVHQTTETAHGRTEFRDYRSLPAPAAVRAKGWRGVRSIGMVYTRCESRGRVTEETRYFLSSLRPGARRLAWAVRSHWQIENGLHWILDVAFREDDCRLFRGYAAENLALLNRLAVSLVKHDRTVKRGAKHKRKLAGWNDDYLLQLLTQT
jgi:predicted transposase YbfD/YdcC